MLSDTENLTCNLKDPNNDVNISHKNIFKKINYSVDHYFTKKLIDKYCQYNYTLKYNFIINDNEYRHPLIKLLVILQRPCIIIFNNLKVYNDKLNSLDDVFLLDSFTYKEIKLKKKVNYWYYNKPFYCLNLPTAYIYYIPVLKFIFTNHTKKISISYNATILGPLNKNRFINNMFFKSIKSLKNTKKDLFYKDKCLLKKIDNKKDTSQLTINIRYKSLTDRLVITKDFLEYLNICYLRIPMMKIKGKNKLLIRVSKNNIIKKKFCYRINSKKKQYCNKLKLTTNIFYKNQIKKKVNFFYCTDISYVIYLNNNEEVNLTFSFLNI